MIHITTQNLNAKEPGIDMTGDCVIAVVVQDKGQHVGVLAHGTLTPSGLTRAVYAFLRSTLSIHEETDANEFPTAAVLAWAVASCVEGEDARVGKAFNVAPDTDLN